MNNIKRKFANKNYKNSDSSTARLLDRDWFNAKWTDIYNFERDWHNKKWIHRYKFGKK